MAEAPLPDDPGMVVPVSFKVSHELRARERDPKLADLVEQLEDCVEFDGRRVLYQWIGGTRTHWRGPGGFSPPPGGGGGWGGAPRVYQKPVGKKKKNYLKNAPPAPPP